MRKIVALQKKYRAVELLWLADISGRYRHKPDGLYDCKFYHGYGKQCTAESIDSKPRKHENPTCVLC